MQPVQHVQVVVGEAVVTWPRADRCRRTIVDVDEPSKKLQLFIFGVLCRMSPFRLRGLRLKEQAS